MAQLNLSATTSYARAASSQSNLGTATTLGFKVRLNGAALLSGQGSGSIIVMVTNVARTTLRLQLTAIHAGGDVYVLLGGPGGSNPQCFAVIDDTLIASGSFYVIRAVAGPGGCTVALFDDSGTQLGTASVAGVTISNSGTANGCVLMGATALTAVVGAIDGAALYSQAPPANNDAPTNADTGILWYVPFDEGSGTSAANDVPGATALSDWNAGWTAGGEWEGTPPPALTAGVATLGTINGFLVQASATDASGGTQPYSYQWQRSPRGAGTWTNVGTDSLTLVDRTVSPSTNYDYRLQYTDDDSNVVVSNVLQPNVPAADVVWGAVGDSNTDEYRADDDRGGGTAYEDVILSWIEQLALPSTGSPTAANHRSLNIGSWGTRSEPRREGYEYNWARSAAQIDDAAGAQLTGLGAQVGAGTVTHCIVQGTVNEWTLASGRMDDIYDSPDGGVTGNDSDDLVADMVSDYADVVEAIVDDLVAAGAVGVVVLAPPDYMEYPAFETLFPDATRRGYYTAAIEAVHAQLVAHAATVNAAAGETVVTVVRWDKLYQEDIWPTYQPGTPGTIDIASAAVAVDVSPDGSPLHFYAPTSHAGTLLGAVVANTFIAAANSLTGVSISALSDAEILENAGIEAGGIVDSPPVTAVEGESASIAASVRVAGVAIAAEGEDAEAGAPAVTVHASLAATEAEEGASAATVDVQAVAALAAESEVLQEPVRSVLVHSALAAHEDELADAERAAVLVDVQLEALEADVGSADATVAVLAPEAIGTEDEDASIDASALVDSAATATEAEKAGADATVSVHAAATATESETADAAASVLVDGQAAALEEETASVLAGGGVVDSPPATAVESEAATAVASVLVASSAPASEDEDASAQASALVHAAATAIEDEQLQVEADVGAIIVDSPPVTAVEGESGTAAASVRVQSAAQASEGEALDITHGVRVVSEATGLEDESATAAAGVRVHSMAAAVEAEVAEAVADVLVYATARAVEAETGEGQAVVVVFVTVAAVQDERASGAAAEPLQKIVATLTVTTGIRRTTGVTKSIRRTLEV